MAQRTSETSAKVAKKSAAKNEQDLHLFERIAFMSRRKGN
jgi:hypothetical protein